MIAEEETADRCGVEISWNLGGDMQKQNAEIRSALQDTRGPGG